LLIEFIAPEAPSGAFSPRATSNCGHHRLSLAQAGRVHEATDSLIVVAESGLNRLGAHARAPQVTDVAPQTVDDAKDRRPSAALAISMTSRPAAARRRLRGSVPRARGYNQPLFVFISKHVYFLYSLSFKPIRSLGLRSPPESVAPRAP
jgi:hypothetical protein